MTFNDKEDVILVENVKSFEVLYNKGHEKYNDIAFKTAVWNGIAIKIGKTVNQCKKRWKNIKAAYLKNKSIMESTGESVKNWPIHKYVSFLDGDQSIQKANPSVSNPATPENQLEEPRPDNASKETLAYQQQNTGPSCSYADDSARSKEDRIAVILAKELKDRNALSNNNTSFTIIIQNHEKDTTTVTLDKKEETLEKRNGVEVVRRYQQTSPQHLQASTPDTVPSQNTRVAQSKETNKVLNSFLKQFEILNEKSETIKSLDLFFNSILLDLNSFCPQAIDEVKLKILNCVSDVRGIYLKSDVPHSSSASFLSCEENIIMNNSLKQMGMLNIKSETAKSMELFFKSVMMDMKDFCNVAMTDAKIRILNCVSEIRDTTYPDFSAVPPEFVPSSNHFLIEARPILDTTIGIPTGRYHHLAHPLNMYSGPIYNQPNHHQ